MDTQSPYTAYFKLYGTQNLQVSFTVAAESPDIHITLLESYLQELFNRGYVVDPKGLEKDEQIVR